MNDYPRSHRVADFIQRELAEMIRTELRDPRISPMLTIASVEVSRDLSVAKVYWSVLDASERAETQAGLRKAAGFLRRRLAREMQIRAVPELRFHHDDSAARGAEMSALIAKAVASNTTVADENEPFGTAGSAAAGSGGLGDVEPARDPSGETDPARVGPGVGSGDAASAADARAQGRAANGLGPTGDAST